MGKTSAQETKEFWTAVKIAAVVTFVGIAPIVWWNSQTIDISSERTLMRRIEFDNLQKLNAMKFQCRCRDKNNETQNKKETL